MSWIYRAGGSGTGGTGSGIPVAEKGVANGVATLDASTRVPLTQLPIMVGSNGSVSGSAGLVPIPTAEDNLRFLRGDGTYQTVSGGGGGGSSSTGASGVIQSADGSGAFLNSGLQTASIVLGSRSSVNLVSSNALTDVDFVFSPKGLGAITTGTGATGSTSTNTRGQRAIDIQTARQTGDVGSGNSSVTLGNNLTNTRQESINIGNDADIQGTTGVRNIILGSRFSLINNASTSAIIGGATNTINDINSAISTCAILGLSLSIVNGGLFSTIVGGNLHTHNNGDNCIIAGGEGNITASANHSGILAGKNNQINSLYGTCVGGRHGNAYLPYQMAIGSGYKAGTPASQTSILTFGLYTYDDIQTILRPDGTTDLQPPFGVIWQFQLLVCCHKTSNGTISAWKTEGVLKSTGFVNTPVIATMANETLAVFALDGSLGRLDIQVTGELSETFAWQGTLFLNEVSS